MKYWSELTRTMYDTAEQCEVAEAEHLKAEEEKKNSYRNAVVELDEIAAYFQACKNEQEEAYRKMQKASNDLHKKYAEFQKNFGRLPEKHYTNFILTRLL